jgi:hypothetical protein
VVQNGEHHIMIITVITFNGLSTTVIPTGRGVVLRTLPHTCVKWSTKISTHLSIRLSLDLQSPRRSLKLIYSFQSSKKLFRRSHISARNALFLGRCHCSCRSFWNYPSDTILICFQWSDRTIHQPTVWIPRHPQSYW